MRRVPQKTVAIALVYLFSVPLPAKADDLKPETVAAYSHYLQLTEAKIDAELAQDVPFLWIGTVFVPGANLAQTLEFMQDYDHKKDYFYPDIQRSKILQHQGDDFLVNLRFYKKKIITIVDDTDHQVHYHVVDATHAWSRSHATRIQEVENPGESNERLDPQGHDRGFLWGMDTYWRFQQKDEGTYVECQSVSLTRDIPTGLGWVVGPFVTSVPRESLTFTLVTARSAELQRLPHPAE